MGQGSVDSFKSFLPFCCWGYHLGTCQVRVSHFSTFPCSFLFASLHSCPPEPSAMARLPALLGPRQVQTLCQIERLKCPVLFCRRIKRLTTRQNSGIDARQNVKLKCDMKCQIECRKRFGTCQIARYKVTEHV